jgi:glutamyl-tRNA synthetase
MPQWAHLPLILGPNGKLSKRDGAKFGFPVFAMNWTDPKSNELTEGFKEKGFLPEAFLNLLAVLGWNDGTEQEIFSLDELISRFSMDRVHKSGAKFDFEKAKWFNHEWIKKLDAVRLSPLVKNHLALNDIHPTDDAYLHTVIDLVKDRCTLIPDFYEQSGYFFKAPGVLDTESVKPKWTTAKTEFFEAYCVLLQEMSNWDLSSIESTFKQLAADKNIKSGELQLPFRIMLVGGKFGPAVFEIANLLGREETVSRIKKALSIFNQ